MRLSLFAVLVAGCAIPSVSSIGSIDDAGTCNALVVPLSCNEVADYERAFEEQLGCNVCITYKCGCESRAFCKLCQEEPPAKSWPCTPPRREPLQCVIWSYDWWPCIAEPERQECQLWGCGVAQKAWCSDLSMEPR